MMSEGSLIFVTGSIIITNWFSTARDVERERFVGVC
jgi:hypothetical protein